MRRNLLVLFLAAAFLSGAAMSGVAADKGPWQASKGALPELATPVGYTGSGAPVYLVRVMKGSVPSLGWFSPSTGKAQILEATRTVAAPAFDAWTGTGRWVPADASSLPADAFSAGKGADGRQVLLARVSYQGWLVPAVFNWQEETAVADIAGTRVSFSTFEVLVPDWTSVKNAGSMPVFAAGTDSDGSDLAPLRAPRGKGLHPGKWSAGSRKGYIPYGGKEIELGQQGYELFIGTGIWVRPQGKALPFGAIQAGTDDDGSALYMVRAKQGGSDALGKFSAARGEAYIPYGGLETKVTSFEVLCYDLSPNREESVALAPPAPPAPAPAPQTAAVAQPAPLSYWQQFQGVPPIHSVAMGVTADATILFLARSVKAGVTSIGYLDPRTKNAAIYGPKQAAASDSFELWAGGGQWVEVKASSIPAFALSAGLDAGKQPVPILRVKSGKWLLPAFYSAAERSLVAYVAGKRTLFAGGEVLVPDWMGANDPGALEQAFQAGVDSDGTALGLLRFPQGRSLQPGKVRLGDGQGYISGDGREIPVGGEGAQLFVGKGAWVQPVRAAAPDGAIPAGWDDDGNPLFMIRAKVSGADVPGKYNEKRNEALVPYGGKELQVTSFEVLCYAPAGGAAVASTTPATPVVAPQQAPPPPPPQVSSGDGGDWKKGTLWGFAANEIHPPNKPAPAKVASSLGYWTVEGKLDESERQEQGLLTDVYTYSGLKDEELDLSVYSKAATPGLYLASPSNKWVEVAPRTGEGDFPTGGVSNLKVVLPETGTYTLVVSNYGESAGPYSVSLQGRPQIFTGTLSATAAFAPVEVTAKVSAFYTIEVTSETFDPTILLVDKKTQGVKDVKLDQQARRASTTVYIDAGQTLVVQVRPASPKASPAPKGPFKVNVRLDGFGS
jgi:hypothetical protein